jgi:hypothetical protein
MAVWWRRKLPYQRKPDKRIGGENWHLNGESHAVEICAENEEGVICGDLQKREE